MNTYFLPLISYFDIKDAFQPCKFDTKYMFMPSEAPFTLCKFFVVLQPFVLHEESVLAPLNPQTFENGLQSEIF